MNIEQRQMQSLENLVSPETIRHNSDGILLVVVNRKTGKILTNVENQEKLATGKVSGQTSIPSETAKNGEHRLVTAAYAVIEEVVGLTTLQETAKQLHFAYFDDAFLTYNAPHGYTMRGALGVLVYDGPETIQRNPTDIKEVTPNGWMSLSDLAQKPNIRPLTQEAIQSVIARNIIPQAIQRYDAKKTIPMSLFIPLILGVGTSDTESLSTLGSMRQQQADIAISRIPTSPRRGN